MKIKISQAVMFLALALCLTSIAGCSRSFRPVAAESNTVAAPEGAELEQTIKNRTFHDPPNAWIKELRIERDTTYQIAANGPFTYPVSLTASDESGVFISDNNAHAILFRAPQSNAVTPLAIKNGELVWPNTIQTWKESIFVSDDDGIKVFNPNGSLQRVLKTYYGINDFTIGVDGTIYINPRFRKSKTSNPLIVQLDREGARVRGFGERLDHENFGNLDDLAYLSAGRDRIVAVFSHRPDVDVYDLRGKLVRQFGLRHPVFESLATLTQDSAYIHPGPSRFRLPTYVAGARLLDDRLIVLLHLPQPEIVELSLQGDEIARYRAKVPLVLTTYRGFDVKRSGDTYHIWVLAGDTKQLALLEFTVDRKI